jgi:hypothetical protein
MSSAEVTIAAVVAICAVAQSLVGVGVLVLGTPLLLLLQVPFPEILLDLLPCSIAINLIQVLTSRREEGREFRRDFLVFCLPAVALGLLLVLQLSVRVNIRPFVALVLLATAALRLLGHRSAAWQGFLRRGVRPLLVLMGLVHGLTNLGGGLLTAVVGSRFERKEEIRANIAFGYLLMATSQIAVLLLTQPLTPGPQQLYLPALAVTVYLLVGNRLFLSAKPWLFQHAVTAFLLVAGGILLVRAR